MSILNRFQQIIINRSCKINLKSLKYYSTEEATSEVEQHEGFIYLYQNIKNKVISVKHNKKKEKKKENSLKIKKLQMDLKYLMYT